MGTGDWCPMSSLSFLLWAVMFVFIKGVIHSLPDVYVTKCIYYWGAGIFVYVYISVCIFVCVCVCVSVNKCMCVCHFVGIIRLV